MRALVLILLLLGGCASPEVRCDSHLRPINAPAAKAVAEPAERGAP
jgi:hypothetical protein